MNIATTDYLRFLFALVFVLALIWGIAIVAKRFGFGNQGPLRLRGPKRLAIVETLAIDTKRRIILVRRDQSEHLILIGGATDLVLESGIPISASLAITPATPTAATSDIPS